jgi:FkbM family methyltransferase
MRGVLLSDLRYRIGTRRLDRARVRFYRRFVGPGSLAFDVGAHTGDRTALLLKAGARVVAIEPQPALRGKLRRAFEADPRVVLVEQAVGPEPGEAVLRWPADNLAVASMSDEWIGRVRASGRFATGEWTNEEVVPTTTLDLLVDEHGLPDFCKIDVEGYEDEVLRGLTRSISAISVEFTPEHLDSTERALRRLEELGEYRFNYALGERLELVEPRWLPRAELLELLRAGDAQAFGDVYALRAR